MKRFRETKSVDPKHKKEEEETLNYLNPKTTPYVIRRGLERERETRERCVLSSSCHNHHGENGFSEENDNDDDDDCVERHTTPVKRTTKKKKKRNPVVGGGT